MTNYRFPSSAEKRNAAIEVVQRLQRNGHIAYWAGGCVRDILLGREPYDYDIATNAKPDDLKSIYPASILTGKRFGVLRVPCSGTNIEVATFRRDSSYSDGRHPDSIEYADPKSDAFRRDFTINAVFFDPVSGEYHDFAKGIDDINNRIVRCVGNPDKSFSDDYLRVLRAIRFACTLDFQIDAPTLQAIHKHAVSIDCVSKERTGIEITRSFMEAVKPSRVLDILASTSLLDILQPELAAVHKYENSLLERTELMLDESKVRTLPLIFSILFHPLMLHGKSEILPHVLSDLRLNAMTAKSISSCLMINEAFTAFEELDETAKRRIVAAAEINDALELHRLHCLFVTKDMTSYDTAKCFIDMFIDTDPLPEPWITGHDLLAMGMPEGPVIGVYRDLAYKAQLNKTKDNRDELMEWIREEYIKFKQKS